MRSGLLWRDSDTEKPLLEKLDDAVTRYYQKFGTPANVAYVNSSVYGDKVPQPFETGTSCGRVTVAPKGTILKNTIWVGVREESDAQAAAAKHADEIKPEPFSEPPLVYILK